MPMRLPGLIVWEQNGLWAQRWRQALGVAGPALREVRTPADCLERLAASPASVVAIEFRPEIADRVLATLWEVERRFPQARSGVLAEREFSEYAPQAFEAGARWFIMSTRGLPRVARFIGRHIESAHATEHGRWAAPPSGTAGELPLGPLLDELFDDLANSGCQRPRQHAIEQLAARLPAHD